MIRNVALVGHGGSGKTTLAEALLARAGAINRIGRVEDGTTASDTEPEEQKRSISISLAVLPFEWEGHKVNLIDTPGYADFVGDVEAALRVADLAVFVVSAVEGVEVQTEVVWRRCAELGVPRMVFVNKLDRERADFERTLDQLRGHVRRRHRPARAAHRRGGRLPRRRRPAHRHRLHLRRRRHPRDRGRSPTTWPTLEHQVHDNLVEGIVVADDELMERYLEGDVPSVGRARAHPRARRRRRHRLPGRVRLGHHRRRRRPPGRLHLRDRALARRPAARRRARRRHRGRGEARRRRASPWPSCSRPSPTRTSASCRCSRCCRARSRPTTSS